MGIKAWAAAAAVAACAWTGTARATVYEFRSDKPIELTIKYYPDGTRYSLVEPFFLDIPLFDLRLGDSIIVTFTVPGMPRGSHEPPLYLPELGFLLRGPSFHVAADKWLNAITTDNTTLRASGNSDDVRFTITYRGVHDFGTVVTVGGENAVRVFSSAVPEPSTWAMMLIGFAGLGFVARRKRIDQSSGCTENVRIGT